MKLKKLRKQIKKLTRKIGKLSCYQKEELAQRIEPVKVHGFKRENII